MPVAYPAGVSLPIRAQRTRAQPAAFGIAQPRRGGSYTEPISTAPPVIWTLTWRLPEAEAALFLQWFTHDLDRGLLEFVLPIRTEFGLTDYTCLFLPGDLMTARQEGALWVYSATVLARELVVEEDLPFDPYFDDVLLLLMGEGANGSTTFTDSSNYARGISIGSGSPAISTAQFKFGASSIYGGGVSPQLLFFRGGAEWAADNWTWDTYYRRAADGNYHGLFYHDANLIVRLKGPTSSGSYELALILDGAPLLQSTSVVPLSQHTHLAVSVAKSGATYTARIFVDGELEASTTSSNTNLSLRSNASNSSLGRHDGGGFAGFAGYIDAYRITARTRWTESFTPPQTVDEYLPES